MARETIEIRAEATRPGTDLETIMNEIARRARERGLTQAKLDELLEDG